MIRLKYNDFVRVIDALEIVERQLEGNMSPSARKFRNVKLQFLDLQNQLAVIDPFNEIIIVEAKIEPEQA